MLKTITRGIMIGYLLWQVGAIAGSLDQATRPVIVAPR